MTCMYYPPSASEGGWLSWEHPGWWVRMLIGEAKANCFSEEKFEKRREELWERAEHVWLESKREAQQGGQYGIPPDQFEPDIHHQEHYHV